MPKNRGKHPPKSILRLPDLEQSKSAVLNSLACRSSQRSYGHAIREFYEWYCSEPRPALNKTVVTATVPYMGHGDHWRCVFPDLENGIGYALGWVSRGPVVGQLEHPTLQVPGGC